MSIPCKEDVTRCKVNATAYDICVSKLRTELLAGRGRIEAEPVITMIRPGLGFPTRKSAQCCLAARKANADRSASLSDDKTLLMCLDGDIRFLAFRTHRHFIVINTTSLWCRVICPQRRSLIYICAFCLRQGDIETVLTDL